MSSGPVLRLSITGDVTERIRLSDEVLNLESVSVSERSEETTDAFRVYGYFSDQLGVAFARVQQP